MTGNTSATGGYLTPVNPLDDGDQLTELFQGFVSGVSGVPGNLVRPRWQPSPPQQPAPTVSWAAFGIMVQTSSDYPQEDHTGSVGAVPGYDTVRSHQTVEVLVSFFGPAAKLNAETLRLGCYIQQNLAALKQRGIRMLDATTVRQLPELVATGYINRCDVTVRFRRQIVVTYQILDIVSSAGTIAADSYLEPFSVTIGS